MRNKKQTNLPADRLWQPTTARWFFWVFGLSLLYAVIRYHLAGGVPWVHFPLFILNKTISLSAVIFIGASYLIGKIIPWHDNNKQLRLVVIKFCGLMGFFLAAVHGFMSFFLLTPAYFAKYFAPDGRLNLQGELGMAVGIIALFFLLSPAITTLPMMANELGGKRWKRSQQMGYLALFLVVVHLVTLGLKGWLTPEKWPAGLIPISLVALVFAVIPLVVKRKTVVEKEYAAELQKSIITENREDTETRKES